MAIRVGSSQTISINSNATEQVTILRGETDNMSKRNEVEHGPIAAMFSWGIGARGSGRFRDTRTRNESATISAELYVPRGSDVQPRDRIVRGNGQKYVVVGHALWDQLSGYTAHDFGWMGFQVESTNG